MQSYDTSRQTTTEPTTSTTLGLPHEPIQRALQQVMSQRAQSDELRAANARPEAVQHAAASGIRGAGGALPHLDRIQASFGRHDVGDVRAHVGGDAKEAASSMGAEAYATGSDVAFGEAPSLHLAAHEAAHVVQQRGGVQLKGGVGEAGDVYERHADAVADRVVAGQSAEALLDVHAGGSPSTGVQMKGEGPETPSSGKADDKTATDKAKMQLTVRWRGKFGGDLSAKVAVTPVGEGETGSATVTDPDADKGAASQTLKHTFAVTPAKSMTATVTPTPKTPDDRYRTTKKKLKIANLAAKESTHTVDLKIDRENEKNVVDVWEQRGIDPKKAKAVHRHGLLGRKVWLNDACKPTIEKTNAALGKLDAATQTTIKDSIIRIGGYNRRTTSKGTFSNHSVGCAVDINYNGPTKQNHHFYKKERSDARLLAFVQKVVRTDPALAAFDIWKDQDQSQIQASQAFGRLFPAYLQDLLGKPASAPANEAPTTPSKSSGDQGEKTAEPSGEAPESPAPPSFDVSAVTTKDIDKARRAEKDKTRKVELALVKSNLAVLKAWLVGTKVKGKDMVGMVPLHEKLLDVMLAGGWGWGGNWSSAKDYMHFEDRTAMASLKKDADASSDE